jgi:hypothetical protein
MDYAMHFETEFILNRQHLEECYDQSLPFSKNRRPRFKFMALLVVTAGLVLLLAEQQNLLAFFLLALALLEFISFRYRRSWWLTRQLWGRNSGNTIKLIIDDQGIKTQSLYNNSELLWSDVNKVDETEKGLVLTLRNGSSSYLSKANLNKQVISFIKQQIH